jgi:hypothetical protein
MGALLRRHADLTETAQLDIIYPSVSEKPLGRGDSEFVPHTSDCPGVRSATSPVACRVMTLVFRHALGVSSQCPGPGVDTTKRRNYVR